MQKIEIMGQKKTRHLFTRIEGIRLHWIEFGEATRRVPVVMLHGLNDCPVSWKRVASARTVRDIIDWRGQRRSMFQHVSEGCGHYLHHEQAQSFAQALRRSWTHLQSFFRGLRSMDRKVWFYS